MFCELQLYMNWSLPLSLASRGHRSYVLKFFLQYIHCSALHKLDDQHNLALLVTAGDAFPLGLSYSSGDYMVA